MYAVFKRELKAYFYSPIAYVLTGLFILMSSIIFLLMNVSAEYAQFNMSLTYMGLILTVIIPMLTMKTLAEDRKNGTEVLLISSPVSLSSIVMGKFLAACSVFFVMTAISLIYPIVTYVYGIPNTPELIGGYLGFILLGITFISIGILASSLTENQVIAAVISFVSLLVMFFMMFVAELFGGTVAKVLNWFSLLSRDSEFNQGILSLGSIIYYLSFTAVILFLTVRIIDRKRWSQG